MHPLLRAVRSDEEFSVFRPIVRAMKGKFCCVLILPLLVKAQKSVFLVYVAVMAGPDESIKRMGCILNLKANLTENHFLP